MKQLTTAGMALATMISPFAQGINLETRLNDYAQMAARKTSTQGTSIDQLAQVEQYGSYYHSVIDVGAEPSRYQFGMAMLGAGKDIIDVQKELAEHAENVAVPSGSCQIAEDYDPSGHDDGTDYYTARVNCPAQPTRVILLSVKDTQENWDETVEACSNILIGTSENKDDGMVKRTYAVSADANVDTISFQRPSGLPDLTLSYELMQINAFKRPYDALPADCAYKPVVHELTCDGDDEEPMFAYIQSRLHQIYNDYATLKVDDNPYGAPADWINWGIKNADIWNKVQFDKFIRDHELIDMGRPPWEKNYASWEANAIYTNAVKNGWGPLNDASIFTGENFKFDFGGFIRALTLLAKEADAQGKEWDTFEKLVVKVTGWNPKTVKSITYEYAEKWGTNGGSSGTQVAKVTIKEGRESTEAISHEAMASVTAGVEFSSFLSPVSAHAEASAQYDFSSASTNASKQYKETEETLTIDFSKPLYVYQKSVTITYRDLTTDVINMGKFVSHMPMKISETIDYCQIKA